MTEQSIQMGDKALLNDDSETKIEVKPVLNVSDSALVETKTPLPVENLVNSLGHSSTSSGSSMSTSGPASPEPPNMILKHSTTSPLLLLGTTNTLALTTPTASSCNVATIASGSLSASSKLSVSQPNCDAKSKSATNHSRFIIKKIPQAELEKYSNASSNVTATKTALPSLNNPADLLQKELNNAPKEEAKVDGSNVNELLVKTAGESDSTQANNTVLAAVATSNPSNTEQNVERRKKFIVQKVDPNTIEASQSQPLKKEDSESQLKTALTGAESVKSNNSKLEGQSTEDSKNEDEVAVATSTKNAVDEAIKTEAQLEQVKQNLLDETVAVLVKEREFLEHKQLQQLVLEQRNNNSSNFTSRTSSMSEKSKIFFNQNNYIFSISA